MCGQNGDRVSKNEKGCHICSKKYFYLHTKNMGFGLYIVEKVNSEKEKEKQKEQKYWKDKEI